MNAQRATAAIATAAILAIGPVAAKAQLDDRTIVDVMRECRKISALEARAGCYDNIPIGERSASAAAPAARPQPARALGHEQLPRVADSDRPGAHRTVVSAAAELKPGIYLLTIEDGAQWQFVDAVSGSYDPPRSGSAIEITPAALGSYLMRYAGQRGVRIRRVR